MIDRLALTGCILIAVIPGCAMSTNDAVRDIELGMSMYEVEEALGQPKAHAEQGAYDAWRYEYRVVGPLSCKAGLHLGGGGTGRNPNCRQVCEHATVWFHDNEVSSATGILVYTLGDCRTQSTPINWEQMPAYAKEPKG